MNYDQKCQLLVIGDSTVGKTSILSRYANDSFSESHLPTVGIDFFTKDEDFHGKVVRVKVWDTAGQERYRSLTNAFYRNAQGIVLVYDVTNRESFYNLKLWLKAINSIVGTAESEVNNVENIKERKFKDHKDQSKNPNYINSINSKVIASSNHNDFVNIKRIVIANKIDLDERAVSREEAEEFVIANNLPYFEVSAKDNIGINESFQFLISAVLADKLANRAEVDTHKINRKQQNPNVKDVLQKNVCKC